MRSKFFFLFEVTNSVLWFSMDSLWMFDQVNIAKFLIVPTIATGLVSAFEKPGIGNISISMAVNAWLLMNIFWMLEMMTASKIFFFIGIALIILSIVFSRNLRVLYRFKRFRK